MNKREFLKTGLIGVVGLATIPAMARNSFNKGGAHVNIPDFRNEFNSLEKFLSIQNLQEHHRIFKTAGNELNNFLGLNTIKVQKVRDILLNARNFDAEVVRNAELFLNHRIFFRTLSPQGGRLQKNELLSAFNNNFGNFGNFKNQFEQAAFENTGSGWVWLVNRKNGLAIINTKKNINPFTSTLPIEMRGYPILGLDMWEHSFYPDYENNSTEYVRNFWNYIDWQFVSKRYNNSMNFKF